MTRKDRYRTDRILNKLHQTFTSLQIKFTRPDASGFLLSREFRPGAQGKLRNVLAFHNKEQFKGESTGINRMQVKKKKKKFGQWQQALGFIVIFAFSSTRFRRQR